MRKENVQAIRTREILNASKYIFNPSNLRNSNEIYNNEKDNFSSIRLANI